MKSTNQNKRPQVFFCTGTLNVVAKKRKRASTGFENPLKSMSKVTRSMHMSVDAFNLPFDEAIRYFRDKANVTTKHWHDVYAAANSRAFMVAGAASDALVADFRAAIDKAIAEGTTLDEFRKDFDQIVARHGWTGWKGEENAAARAWRTQIIYDTNLRAAYAAGRYAQMTAPETLELFPYWQYHHSGSNHPRLEHLSWDGIVLRADDPFWSSNYPPNGWHCGCYVTVVSEAGLKRQGKSAPDPSPILNWVKKPVGPNDILVPTGVDAGFEYNVGQAWLSRTAPGNETVAAAPGIIERFASAVTNGGITNPGAYIPVALAPKEIASYFKVMRGAEIRLVASKVKEHLKKHLVTSPTLYSKLIEYAVSEGTILTDEMGRLMLITEFEGHHWIIGVSGRRGQLKITTVHETSANQISMKTGKGTILRKGR